MDLSFHDGHESQLIITMLFFLLMNQKSFNSKWVERHLILLMVDQAIVFAVPIFHI